MYILYGVGNAFFYLLHTFRSLFSDLAYPFSLRETGIKTLSQKLSSVGVYASKPGMRETFAGRPSIQLSDGCNLLSLLLLIGLESVTVSVICS